MFSSKSKISTVNVDENPSSKILLPQGYRTFKTKESSELDAAKKTAEIIQAQKKAKIEQSLPESELSATQKVTSQIMKGSSSGNLEMSVIISYCSCYYTRNIAY